MATKKQTTRKSTPTRSRKTQAAEPAGQERQPLQTKPAASDDAVAELAHRLYLERGGVHGHDVEDWLEAERRLRNGH